MKNNLFPIAKEGWEYIAYALGAFVLFVILDLELLMLLSFVVVVALVFIFRNPERALPNFEEQSVLCPVDGEVIAIDELNDSEYGYKVTIDGSYKDVGVLRVPINATIVSADKKHGTRLSLESPLASKINENMSIVFEDANNNKVKVSHRVKQSLCGILVDLYKDNKVSKSSRYGVMINGVTEVYLPKNFRLSLILGEETTASQSLVGYFS